MLTDRTLAHVERELQQIEGLLVAYQELLERASTSELDLVELTALASVLHSTTPIVVLSGGVRQSVAIARAMR